VGLVSGAIEVMSVVAAKARHTGELVANVTSGPGGPGGPLTGAGGASSGFGNGGALDPRSGEPSSDYGGWWDQTWTFVKNINEPVGKEAAKRQFGLKKFPSTGLGVDIGITILTVTPDVVHAKHEADLRSDLQDAASKGPEAYERKLQQRREHFAKKFAQKAKQGGGQ
jgi:hypothetical protein